MKKIITLVLAGLLGCNSCTNSLKQPEVIPPLSKQESPVVYFPKVINNLSFVYDNLKREIPMCLEGLIIGNKVLVTDVKLPFIYISEADSASYEPMSCASQNYVGMVHNHIYDVSDYNCIPSKRDLERFENDPHAIVEAIVCKTNRKTDSAKIRTLIKTKK